MNFSQENIYLYYLYGNVTVLHELSKKKNFLKAVTSIFGKVKEIFVLVFTANVYLSTLVMLLWQESDVIQLVQLCHTLIF